MNSSAIGPILADETIPKAGQNIKYDINVLAKQIEVNGVAQDSMLQAYVLDASRALSVWIASLKSSFSMSRSATNL